MFLYKVILHEHLSEITRIRFLTEGVFTDVNAADKMFGYFTPKEIFYKTYVLAHYKLTGCSYFNFFFVFLTGGFKIRATTINRKATKNSRIILAAKAPNTFGTHQSLLSFSQLRFTSLSLWPSSSPM